MKYSAVSQEYKLSLVSGGKPVLPRAANPTFVDRNVSCITGDQQNYIVPFNNQIKVYNVNTRQCVKTLKFANNELLATIFTGRDTVVTDILLGDISQPAERQEDRLVTLVTSRGQLVVLKYVGKQLEQPRFFQLATGEDTVYKVFEREGKFKVLSVTQDRQKSKTSFDYHLSDLQFSAGGDAAELSNSVEFQDVLLSSWSTAETTLVLLQNDKEHQRTVRVKSIFDDDLGPLDLQFPLESLFPDNNSVQQAQTINRFVTCLAVDNSRSQLALGFASGVITLVSLTTKPDQDMHLRYLKWHIDSVLALVFNDDSSYLISGGWEKVLSFWQLSTNMQQFLPRLNGIVLDVQAIGKNSQFYSVALQMTENESNADYQVLLLNAADLTSKLSISGPLPVFDTKIADFTQPVSTINLNSGAAERKYRKKLLKTKNSDFTAFVDINPVTKQLYLPHGTNLQTYDFYKNEQVALQYLTDSIQNHMGKVRNELNVKDPQIRNLKVVGPGDWLVTYEVDYPPEDLLSSNDLTHVLKFWARGTQADETSAGGGAGTWELKTKVLNPHGISSPIVDISACPGENGGVISADNNGGLKYWEFDERENNWCLKKINMPNFNHFSNSVSTVCSRDLSLVFHAFDDKLQIIDFDSFKKIDDDIFNNGGTGDFTMDSEIKIIKLVSETVLLVATETNLMTLDLLSGKLVSALDMYPYVHGNYKNSHLGRLISCDSKSDKVALVINEHLPGKELKYRSHIIVFNSTLTAKLGDFVHPDYISWIGWNHDTDFIFLDISSRLGVVGTTVNTEIADEINREGLLDALKPASSSVSANADAQTQDSEDHDYLQQLRAMTLKKGENGLSLADDDEEDAAQEIIDGAKTGQTLNMNSFSNMFENIQNVTMGTLFDNVMQVLQ